MDDFDVPIFKKTCDLYKLFYSYRNTMSKQDRYTIWQRCDAMILYSASQVGFLEVVDNYPKVMGSSVPKWQAGGCSPRSASLNA